MIQRFFLLTLVCPLLTWSQSINVDLTKDKFDKQTVTPGTKIIVLQNALAASKVYKVTYQITNVPIIVSVLQNPFSPASQGQKAETNGTAGQPNLSDANKCPGGPDLIKSIGKIKTSQFATEGELKGEYDKAKTAIDKLAGDCKTEALDLLHDAELNMTSRTFLPNLSTCQAITVTILRYSKDEKTLENAWELNLETSCEDKGKRFFTYYGFTYQPNVISKYERYFSKADTSVANKFTITKQYNNQTRFWEDLSPTVMFTYLLSPRQKDFTTGVNAIASTNFSTFSAGAGFSFLVGYNLNIGTGIMFTQKYVLSGQYKEGDVIKQNLSFDQLHEKKWGPEIFFTLGLRFDKNPFSGSSSSGGNSTNSSSSGDTSNPTPKPSNGGSAGGGTKKSN